MSGNGQKWFKLWQLLEGQRKRAIVLFVVMFFTAVAEGFGLSLVLPLLSGLIGLESATGRLYDYVDAVRGYMPEGYELEGILAALVFVFLVKSLLVVLRRGLAANYALRLREQWSNQVFSHYLYARYARTSGKKGGILINNVAAEPLKASKAILFLLELANKIILALTLFVILLLTDWQITLAVGSVGIGIFYLIRTQSFNYSVRLGTERLALNQGISADATEGISGLREIKLYGIENRYLSRLAKKLLRYKKIETKFTVLSELPNHFVELAIISLLAGVVSYVHLTSDGELKEVVPVLGFFVLVSQRLFTYMSNVISGRMKVSAYIPALRMIHGLVTDVSNHEDLESGFDFARLDSDIQFKDATFSYTKNRSVFSHLDLTIPHGKMTAIVGPSGIGKSTIADVIMHIFPLQQGKITVNGRDLRDSNLASWRGKIGYVCQDAHLFNASVEENILIGNPDATKVDLVRAARVANAHEFIMKLSSGYTTPVGERGVKLSGGQKQRVAIARAVIRDPELLIFDEATSALDDESERLIQRSIEELAQSKTVLIIAHRISTIERADVIYKMHSDGEVRRTTYAALVCAMDQGDKAAQALN